MDTLQFVLELVDSSTVKLLIVGIAIIAIVALLRTRLSTSPGNPTSLRDIHSYYICGILLLLLIQLGAYIVVEADPKGQILIQYISFASTLSSLILSVLAIIYTLVSNSKGDTHIAKLESASTKLTTSANEFTQQIESLKRITNSIQEFKAIASNLKDDLKEVIGQRMEQIDSRLQINNQYLEQIIGNGQGERVALDEEGKSHYDFEKYLGYGSVQGIWSIYLFLLAVEQGVSRIPLDVFGPNGNYSCGYLVATASVFPVSLQLEASGDEITAVLPKKTDFGFTSSKCENILMDKVKKLWDDEEQNKIWRSKISDVKKKIKQLAEEG